MQSKNKFIIACAGSGKTTSIIRQALENPDRRILLATYTNENLAEINERFCKMNGCVPGNVTVISWLKFLLRDGARPYQNYGFDRRRIRSIYFFQNNPESNDIKKRLRYISEDKPSHYMTGNGFIYEDKLAKFAVKCDEGSRGLVLNRLERMFDYILIDEFQDLASYDLDFLERILDSKISIVGVGDPRQATFVTHSANKNRGYRRSKIYNWLTERQSQRRLVIEEKCESYRCCQKICDFGDALYPELPKSSSMNTESKEHIGVFCILANQVDEYIDRYNPTLLRHSSIFDTGNKRALNFGASKGKDFDRVLIYPTKKMMKYLQTKNLDFLKDKSKFYVAVTRAKYSVAFVVDDETKRLFKGPKQAELFS